MADSPRYFLTTAIDYPNSRPHIGTAFEKLGADVQARYRRMEGYEVFFLMGNDENTVKVSKRAAELGLDAESLLRRHGPPVQGGLARPRHQLRRFHPDQRSRATTPPAGNSSKRYTTTAISIKGSTRAGIARAAKRSRPIRKIQEAGGVCPNHKVPPVRRSEPCYFFALSKFQEKLLQFYNENPDFIQPETRRNEVLNFVQSGLKDTNITRRGEAWGIRVPFDEDFTIYVWFDALLNYITGVGYGDRRGAFQEMVAGRPARHRQGHHAVSLRVVAGHVLRRRHRAAAARLRTRLRLHQERRDRRRAKDQ